MNGGKKSNSHTVRGKGRGFNPCLPALCISVSVWSCFVTRTVNTTKPGSLLLWEIKYNSLGGSWSPIS